MSDQQRTMVRIAEISELLHDRLGAGGPTLAAALRKARHRMPRRIHARARLLAQAEPLAAHPKLCRTLDAAALDAGAAEVKAWLLSIDLADRRKGWWLGMLGGLAFNILLFAALLLVFLRWRGHL